MESCEARLNILELPQLEQICVAVLSANFSSESVPHDLIGGHSRGPSVASRWLVEHLQAASRGETSRALRHLEVSNCAVDAVYYSSDGSRWAIRFAIGKLHVFFFLVPGQKAFLLHVLEQSRLEMSLLGCGILQAQVLV